MQDELIRLLQGRRGHFKMESGYHSEQWFNLDSLFEHPKRLAPFVAELARCLSAHHLDAVCGPLTGGAKLAQRIAVELGIEYFFTERFDPPTAGGLFPVRYLLPADRREGVRGKSIAIVDDAISAGSAVRGTFADLVTWGARPVAVGALFIFGDAVDHFASANQLALEGVARMSFGIWAPSECPLCLAGVAVEKISE